jgi:hypothetical protein
MMRRFLVSAATIFSLSIALLTPPSANASRCPKVDLPTSFFGIFVTTTLLPWGTTVAMGRSSGTLGCGGAEPSDSFYRPMPARVQLYLQESYAQVAEEASRGEGTHLQALAYLAGCEAQATSLFAQELRSHYAATFLAEASEQHTTAQIVALTQKAPLATYCHSAQESSSLPTQVALQ